jgi:DNA-binding NarL/FixJ family response regulator
VAAEISVLVVDDHEVVREGLRTSLARSPHIRIVGEAADGAAAVELALRRSPDVIVMDAEMPTLDGFEAAAALAEKGGEPKALIYISHADRAVISRGFQPGVRGFVLKESPVEVLLRGIEQIAANEHFIDPELLPVFLASREHPNVLTPREQEILQLLADGHSNGQVADLLFISRETVKSHVGHILTKLEASTRTQAVAIAVRRELIG